MFKIRRLISPTTSGVFYCQQVPVSKITETLLTDQPVIVNQLEAVRAEDTCRQFVDPAGKVHMNCDQYID